MADDAMPFNWETGETAEPDVHFWPFATAPREWQALHRGPEIPVAIAEVQKPTHVPMEVWIPVFLHLVAEHMRGIGQLSAMMTLHPHAVSDDMLIVLILWTLTESSHA